MHAPFYPLASDAEVFERVEGLPSQAARHDCTEALGHYKTLIDHLPEAVLTIDPQGFISHANPRAAEMLGKSLDELLDAPISLFIPASAIAPVAQGVSKSAEEDGDDEAMAEPSSGQDDTNTPVRHLVELARVGCPAIFVEVSSTRLAHADGEALGHIVQLRDTTSQQRLTERFKQKIASLESYVHTVSHDLRSPLVSLLGFTKLMKQDYETLLDETGKRFLDRIEQAGANMNTMTQDLLELSTRERETPNLTTSDPRNVLLQIQTELKPRLEAQGVELEIPAAPPVVVCDRTQLYQVFSNLIGNALQHMGPCESPRISIQIIEEEDQHVISVRDNGRGIPGEAHEKIFDAFESLSADNVTPSTGVGLSIVKKIALAHAGDVWVESEPGLGATFCVSLVRH
ncbi:MAG: signal transduction histidine kinase [Myxococcota bacterium]|jgi:signal transduction histidine kinase